MLEALSRPSLWLAASALILAVIVVGCTGTTAPGQEAQASPQAPSPAGAPEASPAMERVVISYPWWGGWDATVADLVQGGKYSGEREAIVVGRVLSADVNYDTSIIDHQPSSSGEAGPPPGHPKAEPVPTSEPGSADRGIPFTHTQIAIERVIDAPGLAKGDTIVISQMGELRDGIAYEAGDDPLILVGRVYLFFVTEARPGTWVSHPAARFEIDSLGRVQAVDREWEKTPAARALRGLTVDTAVARIEDVLAALPAPEAQ